MGISEMTMSEWDRLSKELAALGLLTNLDRSALALLRRICSLDRSHRSNPEIRHHGEVAVGLSKRPTSRS